jgi:hypothetical protein
VSTPPTLSGLLKSTRFARDAIRRAGLDYRAIGDCVVLCDAPNGSWSEDDTTCEIDGEFALSPDLAQLAEEYRSNHEVGTDNDKFSIRSANLAMTDDPSLRIKLQKTLWSDVQAMKWYLDREAPWPDGQRQSIRDLYGDTFLRLTNRPIPSICCLHVVALTDDDYIVASKRAADVQYYPECWSVSYEENLSEKDIHGNQADLIGAAKRGGDEEFFPKGSDVIPRDSVRLFSVFEETAIANTSICAVVRIPLPLDELQRRLPDA